MDPNASEFIFNPYAKDFLPEENPKIKPIHKEKKTLFEFIEKKPKKSKQSQKKKDPQDIKNMNKMIKAHIIQDGQIVTAKIMKKDLYSGAYEVVPRKTTKLKQKIKENRIQEGIPPSQRPICSEYTAREYVTQLITHDLDLALQELIEKLIFFYKRKKEEKSNKKIQKRYVKGFNECLKKCESDELKCVIIAPNIEKVEGPGGLDEILNNLLSTCYKKSIPVIFGLSMRALGSLLINQATILSVIGILDYTACEKLYEKVIKLRNRNHKEFRGIAYDSSIYFATYPEEIKE